MDLDLHSSPPEDGGTKAAFRKPSNDAGSRKYRRRSPVSGSSSADGSPSRDRSNSPIPSRDVHPKVVDNRRRKDDDRDFDRDQDHGKRQYGRTGDSYRYSDRQSSRSSYNYHKNEDYVRHDKHAKEDERHSSKSSPRMRGGSHSDYTRRESEQSKSKDHLLDVEKYSRDRSDAPGHKSRDKDRESSHEYQKYKDNDSSERVGGRRQTNFHTEEYKHGERDRHKRGGDSRDEKRDYRKTSKDRRSDRSPSLEDSRGHRTDVLSRRDSSGHTVKEASRRDFKELDGAKYTKEERDTDYNRETDRRKERHIREEGELVEEGAGLPTDDKVSNTKKPKIFSLEKGKDIGDDVKHTNMADKVHSTSSKESIDNVNKEQDFLKDSDIDAAKVAAMKAAELVNRNLIGTGYMSTDQKKKLLWGSKKATATEEPTHRWDASLFPDRERQEKFKKLMGVKGEVKVDQKPPDNQDVEKVQLDLEKQYTAGLRRRDGRTVGLGL